MDRNSQEENVSTFCTSVTYEEQCLKPGPADGSAPLWLRELVIGNKQERKDVLAQGCSIKEYTVHPCLIKDT